MEEPELAPLPLAFNTTWPLFNKSSRSYAVSWAKIGAKSPAITIKVNNSLRIFSP
jgi:hypothetical protein